MEENENIYEVLSFIGNEKNGFYNILKNEKIKK